MSGATRPSSRPVPATRPPAPAPVRTGSGRRRSTAPPPTGLSWWRCAGRPPDRRPGGPDPTRTATGSASSGQLAPAGCWSSPARTGPPSCWAGIASQATAELSLRRRRHACRSVCGPGGGRAARVAVASAEEVAAVGDSGGQRVPTRPNPQWRPKIFSHLLRHQQRPTATNHCQSISPSANRSSHSSTDPPSKRSSTDKEQTCAFSKC